MKISNCVWPKSIDFNDKDIHGRTRFIQACKNGHNNVVKRHFRDEFSSTLLSSSKLKTLLMMMIIVFAVFYLITMPAIPTDDWSWNPQATRLPHRCNLCMKMG